MLHLKRWQEGKSTFCKWSLLHFVLEKVISLTIEKANTIGNEYNDKKIKCFQVLCNSILDYHSIQWCKIHDNVCFWEPEIRIWVLHMKRGRNADEMNYYFIFESEDSLQSCASDFLPITSAESTSSCLPMFYVQLFKYFPFAPNTLFDGLIFSKQFWIIGNWSYSTVEQTNEAQYAYGYICLLLDKLFLESIKPVSSIILNDEWIKQIIIYENISCCYLKQISSLFFVVYKGMHSRSIYPILQTTNQNNFLFSWVNSCKNV